MGIIFQSEAPKKVLRAPLNKCKILPSTKLAIVASISMAIMLSCYKLFFDSKRLENTLIFAVNDNNWKALHL